MNIWLGIGIALASFLAGAWWEARKARKAYEDLTAMNVDIIAGRIELGIQHITTDQDAASYYLTLIRNLRKEQK